MADVTIASRRIQVFPRQGIVYFLISIVILIAILFFLDRKVIPAMEDQWKVSAAGWEAENARINHGIQAKNHAKDDNWIWRSKLFEVAEHKTKAKRILVMGDSFAWGNGTANMNDNWWRQLARELFRRGYNDVEVIAAGLCGKSTRQELEQAESLVPIYKPDLIIWGYVTNDPDERRVTQIRDLLNPRMTCGYPAVDALVGSFFPNLDTVLLNLYLRKKEIRFNGYRHGYECGDWELQLLHGKNFEIYKRTVAELGDFQRGTGVPGFVMTLPFWPSREYFEPRHAPLKQVFEATGMPFYDILDDFLKMYPDEAANKKNILSWGVNPANGHPGPRCAHFFAVEAADILEKSYPESLGPKTAVRKQTAVRVNDWMPGSMKIWGEKGMHFEYPTDDDILMYMPLRTPHVLLNLEMPVALSEIRLNGKGLASASLYVTSEDSQLHFDTGVVTPLGKRDGSTLVWNLEGRNFAESVNTIRIHALFNGADRRLHLTLVPIGAKK